MKSTHSHLQSSTCDGQKLLDSIAENMEKLNGKKRPELEPMRSLAAFWNEADQKLPIEAAQPSAIIVAIEQIHVTFQTATRYFLLKNAACASVREHGILEYWCVQFGQREIWC
jgi:hypothetical protein